MSGFEMLETTRAHPVVQKERAGQTDGSEGPLAESTGGQDQAVRGMTQELITRARRNREEVLRELVERKKHLDGQIELEHQNQHNYLATIEILEELDDMIVPGEIQDPVTDVDPPQWRSRDWKETVDELVKRFMSLRLNTMTKEWVVRRMFDDMLRYPTNERTQLAIQRYQGYVTESKKRLMDYNERRVNIEESEQALRNTKSAEHVT